MNHICCLAVFLLSALWAHGQAISLHPDNPHYFLYKGQPTVLITSGEHYGAVINRDFDFETYLNTLRRLGLNHTRIFLGDYVERPHSFGILTNTLAPDSTQLITPWRRSETPGYALGGNKFDLDQWNPVYFARLKDFMDLAEAKGIVVEAVLFFISYEDDTSPFDGPNNVNEMPDFDMSAYRQLGNEALLKRQKAYCQKIVHELNEYDNLIFNIINEPWFSNQMVAAFSSPPSLPTHRWIQTVSEWIVQIEAGLPQQHLLAIDYTNEGVEIPLEHLENYFEHISIFNHHYDADAESVIKNYHRVPRAFAFNETGIMPSSTPEYRFQGWKYLMNGGALYNVLDFTWQLGAEDGHGTTLFGNGQGGYMGCTDHDVKYQMAKLLSFWNELDFVHMQPGDNSIGFEYGHVETYGFYEAGKTYVVYFIGSGEPRCYLNILSGHYQVEWFDPRTLQPLLKTEVKVENDFLNLAGPGYREDIVVKLSRLDP
ncbi:MAG: hypothetical protein AAF206_16495 [Bacteroidota bacterium]